MNLLHSEPSTRLLTAAKSPRWRRNGAAAAARLPRATERRAAGLGQGGREIGADRGRTEGLVEVVHRCGYRQFYLAFGDGNLRLEDWARSRGQLDGELAVLVDTFLLQRPIPRAGLESLIGAPLVTALVECGILVAEGRRVRSAHFLLIVVRGLLYFCQLDPDPWAYFGDDSLALAAYQTPVPGGRLLDLCSGPGLQSLVAARAAAAVTGVELNPRAAAVATLNAELNALSSRVAFVVSSLDDYAARAGEDFDGLVFNPPLVPTPARWRFARVGAGGDSGLAVTETVLRRYGNRVRLGGRIEFVGATAEAKGGTARFDRLGRLATRSGYAARFLQLSRHPLREGAPLFEQYAASLALHNRVSPAEARRRLAAHYRKSGQEEFVLFFASLTRVGRAKPPVHRSIDLSFGYYGDWFL